MSKTDIHKILHDIQQQLVAPKDAYNSFAKYNYRSAESILGAVKPLLPKGSTITFNDEMKYLGDRYYVESTVCFNYMGEKITAKGSAREPLEKKGADTSQVTGATTSYARKYALGALLIIDDNPDSDVTNKQTKYDRHYTGDEFPHEGFLNQLQAALNKDDVEAVKTIWRQNTDDGIRMEIGERLTEQQKIKLRGIFSPPPSLPAEPLDDVHTDAIEDFGDPAMSGGYGEEDEMSYGDKDDGFHW